MKALQRILYVEDDADIQTVARLALEMLGGYEVRVCSSGAEALQTVPGWEPDLVLLDVMMPVMDGPATLQALQRLPGWGGRPVVFMTARVQPEEVAAYIDMGAVGVIAKPFDPTTLAQQVQALWAAARPQGLPDAAV